MLVPLVMSIVGSIEPAMTAGMGEMIGQPYQSPLTLMAGPIPIHLASFADFVGVLVIVIIIFDRFLRIQRDQEHANSELAAARSVQELMIPQEKLATPGFEVDLGLRSRPMRWAATSSMCSRRATAACWW